MFFILFSRKGNDFMKFLRVSTVQVLPGFVVNQETRISLIAMD